MLSWRNLAEGLLCVLVTCVSSPSALAQPPDILRNYRVIPRHSSLEVSGGIAGIHHEYDLFGKFGLVTGFKENPIAASPLPVIVPYAEFVDVNIKALLNNHLAFAGFVPLDNFVDLESLDSLGDTPPVLHFRGTDSQGAPFQLRATQHGRLIHLRGRTEPICCDFFQYDLNVLAYQTPFGDFNFDGRVDSSDYTRWRDSMGSTTDLAADGNGDGIVDHGDYEIWADQFGTPAIDMSALAAADGFGSLSAAGVPEPSSCLLMVVAGCGALLVRSTRLRRR